jgi:hypothetical protein
MEAVPNNTIHIFIITLPYKHTYTTSVSIPTLLSPPVRTCGQEEEYAKCSVVLPLYYYQLNMHIHIMQRYKLNLT